MLLLMTEKRKRQRKRKEKKNENDVLLLILIRVREELTLIRIEPWWRLAENGLFNGRRSRKRPIKKKRTMKRTREN
jgi:hypothetical protein